MKPDVVICKKFVAAGSVFGVDKWALTNRLGGALFSSEHIHGDYILANLGP